MKKEKSVSIELTQKEYDALVLFFSAGEYLLESSNPGRKKNKTGDALYMKLFEKGPAVKSKNVAKLKREDGFTLTSAAEKEINKGLKAYNHSVVNEAMMSMMMSTGTKKKH